jgi:hypothetical protein
MRHAVTAFGRRHGMGAGAQADVGGAVAEAVAVNLRPGAPADLIVDAATDGVWLSVRVRGSADTGSDAASRTALPLATALADRIEWEPGRHGAGATALMEFPMGAAAGGDDAVAFARARCQARSRLLAPGVSGPRTRWRQAGGRRG